MLRIEERTWSEVLLESRKLLVVLIQLELDLQLFPDAKRRSHAGFDPLEYEVVDAIAGKLLERADVEQLLPYLCLAQFRCEKPLPVISPKYRKPSDGELFAAVEL